MLRLYFCLVYITLYTSYILTKYCRHFFDYLLLYVLGMLYNIVNQLEIYLKVYFLPMNFVLWMKHFPNKMTKFTMYWQWLRVCKIKKNIEFGHALPILSLIYSFISVQNISLRKQSLNKRSTVSFSIHESYIHILHELHI